MKLTGYIYVHILQQVLKKYEGPTQEAKITGLVSPMRRIYIHMTVTMVSNLYLRNEKYIYYTIGEALLSIFIYVYGVSLYCYLVLCRHWLLGN